MVELCACITCAAKLLSSCCLALFKKDVSLCLDLDMNLRSLIDAERELEDKASNVKNEVERDVERDMRADHSVESKPEITQWLDRVQEVFIKSPRTDKYEGKLRFACCYCCSSCDLQLHRKVKEKLEKVNHLNDQGDRLPRPYTEAGLVGVITNRSYSPSILGMQRLLEPLWLEFRDASRNVIGVFGPGGVGKTTLLQEFKKEVERSEEYQDVVVIFIEVANSAGTLNVADMQKAITSQLNYEWHQNQGEKERAEVLLRLLRGKKFVVLLDAVWKSFQLEEVGIPYPANGSKLIVASWSENVCTKMGATRPIEMKGLEGEEAMQLFVSNWKEDLQAKIKENSQLMSSVEVIVTRCGGLPLALSVLGSAFACLHYPDILVDAANNMYDHSKLPDFDIMLYALERSYNALDETTKKCFLYCVLFPDHGSMDNQLLQDYWVAEGLISGSSTAPGYRFISNLISACLLHKNDTEPESEVKMHYMIREMGIRLAKKQRYVIEAGHSLRRAPAAEKWTKAARISLISYRFDELSISPKCPALQTLLLQNNPSLKKLGSNLFRNMPQLKVLDLSHTAIDWLPDCGALRLLAYLNLSHTNIKELRRDICDNLGKLLYLNMSHTRFTELPSNLFKLEALTHLILSETPALKKIPNGTISKLFALRVLNLYKSHYGVLELPDLNLENLEELHTLGITIHSEPVLDKLRNNQPLAKCTRFLSLSDCQGMQSIKISKFESMQQLQELNIESCNGLESIDASISENKDRGGSLKVLNLKILSDLHKVVVPQISHHFCLLRHLTIHACHKLVNVSWVLQLHSLERLEISECSELEEIAQEQSNGATYMTSTTGESQEVINAAAASTISTSISDLQSRDASSQNGVAVAIALERFEISECSELEEIAQELSNGATNMTSTTGESQEVINAAAASTTSTSISDLQSRDASSQNGLAVATAQLQCERIITTMEGTNIGDAQEERNAAAETTMSSSNLQGRDASTSQNGGCEANVEQHNNKIMAVGGAHIGDIQQEINGSTFTDINRQKQDDPPSQNGGSNESMQEQSNSAAPRSSIVCEVQEEIDDTPSTQANLTNDVQANKQDNIISYGDANLQQTHGFDRLRIIVLKDLSKLKSICTTSDFPCLASINVRACPILRSLPVRGMPKLKQIHGEKFWWDGLPQEMKDCLRNCNALIED